MAKIVESFRAGDAVPDWLVSQTPREDAPVGMATPGSIYFPADCHLIEVSDGLMLIADSVRASSAGMIEISGMNWCNIVAANGPLAVAVVAVVFGGGEAPMNAKKPPAP